MYSYNFIKCISGFISKFKVLVSFPVLSLSFSNHKSMVHRRWMCGKLFSAACFLFRSPPLRKNDTHSDLVQLYRTSSNESNNILQIIVFPIYTIPLLILSYETFCKKGYASQKCSFLEWILWHETIFSIIVSFSQ